MSEEAPEPAEKIRWVQVVMEGEEQPNAPPLHQRTALVCKARQVIARTIELLPDTVGPPDAVELSRLKLGKNVAWDGAGVSVVAQRAGQICLRSGVLCVEEVLEISEDVSAGGGLIDFPGNVVARQGILDRVHLTAAGDVEVHGCVEAAIIRAVGSLTVHRGICGKDHGRADAGGGVRAKFITNSTVHAGGDIVVASEITNSHVFCKGKLDAERATIVGGHVGAIQGMTCHTAGSPCGMKTVLEMGLAPDELAADRAAIEQVAALRQRAQHIRQAVEPLMKNLKRLTSAQKEKATELLCLADEAETMASGLVSTLTRHEAEMTAAMDSPLRVVHELLQGVTIRYPLREATIGTALRGPVKIVLLKKDGASRIVSVDPRSGSVTPLPCKAVDAHQEALIRKLREFARVPAQAA